MLTRKMHSESYEEAKRLYDAEQEKSKQSQKLSNDSSKHAATTALGIVNPIL